MSKGETCIRESEGETEEELRKAPWQKEHMALRRVAR